MENQEQDKEYIEAIADVAYTYICENPGIEFPVLVTEICETVDINKWRDDIFHNDSLHAWLMKHHRAEWSNVCSAVDMLTEEQSSVIFDGETGQLYQMGYCGPK